MMLHKYAQGSRTLHMLIDRMMDKTITNGTQHLFQGNHGLMHILFYLGYFRSITFVSPSGEPTTTISAILIKKPSSITPVIPLTCSCKRAGSSIRPKEQSRI